MDRGQDSRQKVSKGEMPVRIDLGDMADVLEKHQNECGTLGFVDGNGERWIECAGCGLKVFRNEGSIALETEDMRLEAL